MYEAPKLQKYGTLRELTLGGGDIDTDNASIFNPNDSCIDIGPPNYQCVSV